MGDSCVDKKIQTNVRALFYFFLFLDKEKNNAYSWEHLYSSLIVSWKSFEIVNLL